MIFLSLLSGLFLSAKSPDSLATWLLVSIYLMTALPWPAGIESKVVHGLTNLISQLTTEIILLSGFPAEMGGTPFGSTSRKSPLIRRAVGCVPCKTFFPLLFSY